MARTPIGKAILNGIPDNAMLEDALNTVIAKMRSSDDPRAIAEAYLEAVCLVMMACDPDARPALIAAKARIYSKGASARFTELGMLTQP